MFSLRPLPPAKKSKIPRIIIQTVKSKDNIPTQWLPSQASIKTIMPDWDYKLFDDVDNRNLVKEVCPFYLPYYDSFEFPIERVDFVRSVYMTKFGGVYMDSDFEVLQRLDPLFEDGSDLYFVRSGNVGKYLTNSLIASAPGHPFWEQYRQEMIKPNPWWAFTKHFKVMCQTGPIKLSWAAAKYRPVFSYLPQKLVMPCSVCEVGRCNTEGAYLGPLEGKSWCGWDSHVLNYLLCNWRKLIVYLAILIIVAVAVYVLWKRGAFNR